MVGGLYKNKYRIKTARREGCDYAQDGYYFVTICTAQREMFFGEVIKGEMILNEIGKLADRFWYEIPTHFPFASLDEFIVMPNHMHGIIIINRVINHDAGNATTVENHDVRGRDVAMQRLYAGKYPQLSKISPTPGSLSTIIRSYKSIVTDTTKKYYPDNNFAWQTRFYDHIIRDEKSLNRIRQYVINNPLKWELDRNNQENTWM